MPPCPWLGDGDPPAADRADRGHPPAIAAAWGWRWSGGAPEPRAGGGGGDQGLLPAPGARPGAGWAWWGARACWWAAAWAWGWRWSGGAPEPRAGGGGGDQGLLPAPGARPGGGSGGRESIPAAEVNPADRVAKCYAVAKPLQLWAFTGKSGGQVEDRLLQGLEPGLVIRACCRRRRPRPGGGAGGGGGGGGDQACCRAWSRRRRWPSRTVRYWDGCRGSADPSACRSTTPVRLFRPESGVVMG